MLGILEIKMAKCIKCGCSVSDEKVIIKDNKHYCQSCANDDWRKSVSKKITIRSQYK